MKEMDMNVRRSLLLLTLATTAALAACATRQPGPMMARGQQMPMMDMAEMCDMHQKMMAGKSPQEQQEMMEQHMMAMHGSADPRMVARHREMMERNCAGVAPGSK
jgi:nitrous oxide reductase accessory protein NosL